ncbi:MAG TPA: YgjP-like metallopeptidase domain-containing protein, partial [Casimicrobiaceae bacterium]
MRLEAPPARRTDASLRRVVLNGETVDYRLIRARRRSIGMEVHLDGLTVRAPMRVALREIETALVERAKWILDALAQWRGRRRDVMPREWRTGETIAFRGDTLALALHPARRTGIVADLFHLVVRHPHAYDQLAVAQCVVGWLREQAQALVAPRVMHHVRRIGLRSTPSVRLSNARSEWGSCNASGDIRLNWRLVQLPPALAEYVVAHEVA